MAPKKTPEAAVEAMKKAAEEAVKKPAPERVDHCGLPFKGRPKECNICCKDSDLFGISSCYHPVCIECAVRMKVLAEHRSCPQCRADIVWTHIVKAPEGDWDDFVLPKTFLDHPTDTDAFKVRFDSDYARVIYDRLLSHSCETCNKGKDRLILPSFEALRQHIGQKHKRFFCHICAENMRLFSWERKTYSSEGLQMHMKKGDKDDKSYRGHPACFFCPERFFDLDQQYKHLRKEHFFCQICDSDGISNVFYKKRAELAEHYSKSHYPCSDTDCNQMGIVFKTELELNVHKATEHGSNRNRRVVEVNFPRSDRQNTPQSPQNRPRAVPTAYAEAFPSLGGSSDVPEHRQQAIPSLALQVPMASRIARRPIQQPRHLTLGTLQSSAHFPSLSEGTSASTVAPVLWRKPAPKPMKKELAKPDLWPDLLPNNNNQGPSSPQQKFTSLKDLSTMLQAKETKSQEPQEAPAQSSGPKEPELSKQEGKKKKKKGGRTVAMVKLEDLDRLTGPRY
ncbi:hypothetical protein L596_029924 [Steinernema carpocapsae]|uniref:RING-type domain-containing protein n=1 Tax=Steinernema carpocapsae TaxID=34508 RepID=A0A4V5ZX52_STECR|nr:hypothetical protein L596_029924 [Steinernema carpocapsae]